MCAGVRQPAIAATNVETIRTARNVGGSYVARARGQQSVRCQMAPPSSSLSALASSATWSMCSCMRSSDRRTDIA
jgi:hypothetical protein